LPNNFQNIWLFDGGFSLGKRRRPLLKMQSQSSSHRISVWYTPCLPFASSKINMVRGRTAAEFLKSYTSGKYLHKSGKRRRRLFNCF